MALPPKRDKFAALASRTAAAASNIPQVAVHPHHQGALPRQAPSLAVPPGATPAPAPASVPPAPADLRDQRRQLLQDLDQAEQWTCRLLSIARDTTEALQGLSETSTESSERVSQFSRDYRDTLRALHPLLQSKSHLVRAYQNHQEQNKEQQSGGMYGARVELRLAQERTQVLEAMYELEMLASQEADQAQTEDSGKKRAREE